MSTTELLWVIREEHRRQAAAVARERLLLSHEPSPSRVRRVGSWLRAHARLRGAAGDRAPDLAAKGAR